MAMSAEHRPSPVMVKLSLQMSEKLSSWTINHKQTNKPVYDFSLIVVDKFHYTTYQNVSEIDLQVIFDENSLRKFNNSILNLLQLHNKTYVNNFPLVYMSCSYQSLTSRIINIILKLIEIIIRFMQNCNVRTDICDIC